MIKIICHAIGLAQFYVVAYLFMLKQLFQNTCTIFTLKRSTWSSRNDFKADVTVTHVSFFVPLVNISTCFTKKAFGEKI